MKQIRITIIFLLVVSSIYAKDFNIGIIGDSKDQYLQEKKLIMKELKNNFYNSGAAPKITNEIFINNSKALKGGIEQLEKNKVDAILLVGEKVSEASLKVENYKVPTIALDGTLKPNKEIKNLNYLSMDGILKNDLDALKKIKEIKKLAIYAPNDNDASLEKVLAEYGIEGVYLTSESTNLEKDISSSDAIYILKNNRTAIKNILEVAKKNKVLTISRVSSDKEINDETMIYFNSNEEAKKRVRIAAVNLKNISQGKEINHLTEKVNLSSMEMFFNYNLAQDLNIYPKIEYLQEITLTETRNLKRSSLSFVDGANLALDKNTTIKSSGRDLKASKYDITTTKAERRPNVNAYTEYKRQDSDTSEADWTGPENSIRGGISLNYILFDDEVNSDVTVSKLRSKSNEYRYNQKKLDTIREYSNIYLNILTLKSELEIEKTNYVLLNKYLKIAKTKYRVGSEGPQDIYRFESELSKSLGNISEIRGNIKTSESKLNKVLNTPMTNLYTLGDIKDTDKPFLAVSSVVKKTYRDDTKNNELRNYLMGVGIKNSPELKQLDTEIAVTERKYLAAKRLRYMPKLSANGDVSDDLKDSWGEGSEDKQDTWTAGLRVELPLIKGGSIESNKKSLSTQLESLKYQKETLENETSQNVLSSLNNVEKYYIQTLTSKENMTSAKKNLGLVENLYIEGSISISDLLDARTDYIDAVLDTNATTYSYLSSIVDLQRSIGKNFVTMDPLEVKDEMIKIKNILK